MKKKLIKYLTLITILIFISTSIFTQELNSLDEIWNFSYSKNITDGLIPYKDFTMIVTPLYAYINSITLRLLTPKLYIYRINYIILFTFLINNITKLLTKINIKEYKIYISILIYSYFLFHTTYSDYNFFNTLLLISLIYLENKNYNKKEYITSGIIGIICGLMILTKQTTGMIISITSIIIIPIILYLTHKEKQIKYILVKISTILIIIIFFILQLYKNHTIIDFIDQTIIGLNTFKKNLNLNYIQIIIIILIINTIIYLIKNFYKTIKNKDKNYKFNIVLISYSIVNLSLNYPIIDPTHFIISIIPTSLHFIINFKPKLKLNAHVILITLMLLINYESYKNIKNYIQAYKPNNFDTYKYIKINNIDNLNIITNYIKENENVIILDHTSSYYMTAINKYNKYFNMPLAGNIGSNGENEMIKKLKEKNYIILIKENDKIIKEEFPNLYKYIKNNYKNNENIKNFKIYKK